MSAVEAVTNTAIGYAVAVATQLVVFPLFGLTVSLTQNIGIAIAFTAVSLARNYILRRIFERIHRGRQLG